MTNSVAYSRKLAKPAWQKKRLSILQRDGWKCTKCDESEKELHVHHLKYTGEPWDAPDEDLKTLCFTCHKVSTWLNKYRQSEIEYVKYYYWDESNDEQIVCTSDGWLYVFFYRTDSDELEFRSSVPSSCIIEVHNSFYPKPVKTRKKKNV